MLVNATTPKSSSTFVLSLSAPSISYSAAICVPFDRVDELRGVLRSFGESCDKLGFSQQSVDGSMSIQARHGGASPARSVSRTSLLSLIPAVRSSERAARADELPSCASHGKPRVAPAGERAPRKSRLTIVIPASDSPSRGSGTYTNSSPKRTVLKTLPTPASEPAQPLAYREQCYDSSHQKLATEECTASECCSLHPIANMPDLTSVEVGISVTNNRTDENQCSQPVACIEPATAHMEQLVPSCIADEPEDFKPAPRTSSVESAELLAEESQSGASEKNRGIFRRVLKRIGIAKS